MLLHPVGLMLELLDSSLNDSLNYSHTHSGRIPGAKGWVSSLHRNLLLFFRQLFSLSEEPSARALRMVLLNAVTPCCIFSSCFSRLSTITASFSMEEFTFSGYEPPQTHLLGPA